MLNFGPSGGHVIVVLLSISAMANEKELLFIYLMGISFLFREVAVQVLFPLLSGYVSYSLLDMSPLLDRCISRIFSHYGLPFLLPK